MVEPNSKKNFKTQTDTDVIVKVIESAGRQSRSDVTAGRFC